MHQEDPQKEGGGGGGRGASVKDRLNSVCYVMISVVFVHVTLWFCTRYACSYIKSVPSELSSVVPVIRVAVWYVIEVLWHH